MAQLSEDIINFGFSTNPNTYRVKIVDKGNKTSRCITIKEHIGINPDYFLDMLYNRFKDAKTDSPNRFRHKYTIHIDLVEDGKRIEYRFINFSEVVPVRLEMLYQETRALLLKMFSELSMQKFKERKDKGEPE